MISETLREVTTSLNDGEYRIVSTLKEGRLYLAEKAGKRFLLKTAAGAKGLEQLKREYELSIGLSHPGLAYVFTYEEDTPVGPCLVQEYVDGETLAAWLTRNPPARERRRIYSELLSVVGYLHQKGVVHNDLKPDNILVSKTSGFLKLIDLGFADDDTHLEKAVGGTRSYASPELLTQRETDARSDIYSIGRLLQDIFPRRYGRIARHCLRAEPERRYPSVAALEKAWRRRSLPWIVASGLLVASLLLWSVFSRPAMVTAPTEHLQFSVDSLQRMVDSLQSELSARDLAEKEKETALVEAKAKVDAVYSMIIPRFRKELAAATTEKETVDAWLAFLENQKKVNFDIPAATPEAVRPALRDYVLQRNVEIQSRLDEEIMARIAELQQ